MDALLARLRRLAPAPDPDGDLLARFARTGDEAAFAELVRRHGPLVYAAARRRLPDPGDAADVFQATFLVLVRKAPGLIGRGSVGPWLYRVAALTARNLRRRNARRLARRRPLADVPARPDVRPELDDALLLLPERDRAAVVLCHLLGLTRREAAERLGVPEGTLSSALSRARRKLRGHLGGDPGPVLVVGGLVPLELLTATTRATAGPAVVALSREVLRMFWLKKLAAGGMTVAACLGVGVGVGLAPRPAAVAAADPPAKADAPAAKAAVPGLDGSEVGRLRKLATEAAAVARERAAAADRAEDQLARQRAAGAAVRLLFTADGKPRTQLVRLVETDAAGRVVADYGCGDGKPAAASVGTHLRRAMIDPAGPRLVSLEVATSFDPFDLGVIAQAVADAGFPTVTYTGPLPESWTLGKNQDGKPARSWTGMRLVTAERVELVKVLPLDPPSSVLCMAYIRLPSGTQINAPLGSKRTAVEAVTELSRSKGFDKILPPDFHPARQPDRWDIEVRRRVRGGDDYEVVERSSSAVAPDKQVMLVPGDEVWVTPVSK